MLQGMVPAQARAVRDTVGTVILSTPVVAPADFDVAVSYLVRRLEENAQPESFLHALVTGDAADGLLPDPEARFRAQGADRPGYRAASWRGQKCSNDVVIGAAPN